MHSIAGVPASATKLKEGGGRGKRKGKGRKEKKKKEERKMRGGKEGKKGGRENFQMKRLRTH